MDVYFVWWTMHELSGIRRVGVDVWEELEETETTVTFKT